MAGRGSFYRSQHELICVFKKGTSAHVNSFELGQHGRSRTRMFGHTPASTRSKRVARMSCACTRPSSRPGWSPTRCWIARDGDRVGPIHGLGYDNHRRRDRRSARLRRGVESALRRCCRAPLGGVYRKGRDPTSHRTDLCGGSGGPKCAGDSSRRTAAGAEAP
jgi:hypothetical protein